MAYNLPLRENVFILLHGRNPPVIFGAIGLINRWTDGHFQELDFF